MKIKDVFEFSAILLRGRIKGLFLLLLVLVVSVAATFETPVLVKEVGQAHTTRDAGFMAAALLLVGSIGAVATHYTNVVGGSLVFRGIEGIRLRMQRRIYMAPPGLSAKDLDNVAQTAYRRLNSAANGIMNGIIPLISAVVILVASAVSFVTIAGKFAFIALAVLVPAVLLSLLISRARARALAERSTAQRIYTFAAQDVLGAAGLERLHRNGDPHKLEDYKEQTKWLRKSSFDSERKAAAMSMPVSIGSTATTASLLMVALLVHMQASASTAILTALAQMSGALVQAFRSWARVQELRSPVENTLKVFRLPVLPAYVESQPRRGRLVSLKLSRGSLRQLRSYLLLMCELWLFSLEASFRHYRRVVGGSRVRAACKMLYEVIARLPDAWRRIWRKVHIYKNHRACRKRRLEGEHRGVHLRKGGTHLVRKEPPTVELENVSYMVRDESEGPEQEIIAPVSLTLKQGVHMIVGNTGEGKSTVAKLICGLFDPTTGRVLVSGIDMRGLRWGDRRELLVTLLAPRFFRGSKVRDVLTSAAGGEHPDLINQVLTELGLSNLDLDSDPTKLSKGKRQLIAIAEAILRLHLNPQIKVLVMDEHTVFLDPRVRKTAERALARYYAGRVVIVMASRPPKKRNKAVTVYDVEGGRITRR